jgi:hypothetical protein
VLSRCGISCALPNIPEVTVGQFQESGASVAYPRLEGFAITLPAEAIWRDGTQASRPPPQIMRDLRRGLPASTRGPSAVVFSARQLTAAASYRAGLLGAGEPTTPL